MYIIYHIAEFDYLTLYSFFTLLIGTVSNVTSVRGLPLIICIYSFNAIVKQIVDLALYRRTKDLVPLFDPKGSLFENSAAMSLAQLHRT